MRFSLTLPGFALAIFVSIVQAPRVCADESVTPIQQPQSQSTLASRLLASHAQSVNSAAGSSSQDIDIKEIVKAIVEDSSTAPCAVPTLKLASADTSAPQTNTDNTTTNKPKGTAGRIGSVIKANIVQTFELDPRLKKDLTDQNWLLRPIKLVQDNYATGYIPNIMWEKDPGANGHWITSYTKRGMSCYIAGPVTKHLSGWFQALPDGGGHGFFQNWELFQGLANYGTDKTMLQVHGGQAFMWQNQGFGGADRTITLTSPGVYSAFNGFNPSATSKAVSLNFTGLNWTTGKIFGFNQPATGTSNDANIAYSRCYGGGLSFEKLFGKEGISGIQTNLTVGSTNLFNGNTLPASQVAQYNATQGAQQNANQFNTDLQAQADNANQAQVQADLAAGIDPDTAAADGAAAGQAVIDGAGGFLDPVAAGAAAAANIASAPIGKQTSPFVWWTSWINHSFQDKEGYIRLNPSFGLTTFEVKRYLDDAAIPENRSKGYGYTFDLMAVPVRSYWTSILRMDALNASDLIHRNTQYTFTVGQAFDLHCGNKSRIRFTLDYQVVAQQGTTATQRFILGFWPIW